MTAPALKTAAGPSSGGDAVKHWLADKLVPAALGAAAVGVVGLASGYLNLDLPPWAIEQIKQGGSAIFILVMAVAAVIYYVPRDAVGRYVRSAEATAVEMGKIAAQLEVLNGQSGKLDEIKSMLQESHVNLMVITDRIMAVEGTLIHVARENNS